jgi:hypothetical protein
MARIKLTRVRAAAATALLSLTLAAPAFADHGDWNDDDRRRRGYPVHRHDRSCDHDRDGWERGRDRGHWERGYYGDRGHYEGRGQRNHDEYACRPCSKRWESRHRFHRHLSRHHGVPFWALPRVIVQTGWGWVFFG